MAEIFALDFIENLKIIFVGLMLYAIIYAMLKKVDFFPSERVGALVALLAAIIVSLTGIVTYIVAYALNWFIIIFFILFLLIVLLLFLGVKMSDIASAASGNAKTIVIIFFLLFGIIFFKGFLGVNNQFDAQENNPDYDPYNVDTSQNLIDADNGLFDKFDINIDLQSETVQVAIFLIIIGGFVFMISKE